MNDSKFELSTIMSTDADRLFDSNLDRELIDRIQITLVGWLGRFSR